MRNFIICTLYQIIRVIKSRRMRQAGHIGCMKYKCIQHFSWKAGRETSPGKCRYRTEENIKIDLKEMGYKGVDWFYVAQDREQ
jgi:hypothetical protein